MFTVDTGVVPCTYFNEPIQFYIVWWFHSGTLLKQTFCEEQLSLLGFHTARCCRGNTGVANRFNTSTYSARLYLTRNGLEAFPPDVPGPSRYSSFTIFLPALACDFSKRLGDLFLQNEERQTYVAALETDVKARNVLLLLSATRSRWLLWGPTCVSKHAQAVRLSAMSRSVPQCPAAVPDLDCGKTHRACAAHPNRSPALESRDPGSLSPFPKL